MTIVNFTPVTALAGGILIGVASVWLLAANGRIAGISGILHGLFAQPRGDRPWRLWFIGGLLAAGFLWRTFRPTATPDLNLGWMAMHVFIMRHVLAVSS